MRVHQVDDPEAIDEELLIQIFEQGAKKILVQFSKPSAYDEHKLAALNRACRTFGANLQVRFWCHSGTGFDCRTLRRLPAVKSLLITTNNIANAEDLVDLPPLEEFSFNVYRSDLPQLLEIGGLAGVRKLTLAGSHKKNINLEPLVGFHQLKDLFIQAHTKNIQVLERLRSVEQLGLSGMGNKQSLNFIPTMDGLRSLRLLLGSRENMKELAHKTLERLEILRVRGLQTVELTCFPKLESLQIEDQLQLQLLDVSPVSQHLRRLVVRNCKQFSTLEALRDAGQLQTLWLGVTAVDPDLLLSQLPNSLRNLSLYGYGNKRDTVLENLIATKGYTSAVSVADIWKLT